ncbi:MAG: hypothetical protein KBG84_00090 [Planctomycetes bacterium]|nr:hypothetical protein [Planctomycetota bacterium]
MRNLLVLSIAANLFFMSAVGLAWGFGGSGAQAQDGTGKPAIEEAAKGKEAAAGLQMMQMAYELARYGRETKNPGALAMASRILTSVKVTEPKAFEGKFKDSKDPAGTAMTPESLLAEAKEMAGESAAPFMDAIAAMGMKGRGLERGVAQIKGITAPAASKNAEGKLAYGMAGDKFTFTKGEYAAVWVGGDGSTDLDLFVVDKDGKIVAADQRPGDSCWVEFVPTEGEYQVLIVNWGNKANKFSIVFN